MYRKKFSHIDKPNGAAMFDLGAANAFLSLEATSLGLNVHQMGGFEKHMVVESLNIPDTHDPVVIMAIGYLGDIESLPQNLKERDRDQPGEQASAPRLDRLPGA
jgi:nitroreductase